MNLIKMLATHEARKEKAIKDSIDRVSNPAYGLCKECDHKLYKTGKNKTRCEYHWLKNKYNGFSSKCRIANEGGIVPYELTFLIKIKCKFDWRQFIEWCIANPQYKKMKNPKLNRINKKKHYQLNNLVWEES
jgi:hypothetical protein